MKQSQASIERTVNKLYKIAQGEQFDDVEIRIAYAVASAIRWANEDTVGWKRPEEDIFDEALTLKEALKHKVTK